MVCSELPNFKEIVRVLFKPTLIIENQLVVPLVNNTVPSQF